MHLKKLKMRDLENEVVFYKNEVCGLQAISVGLDACVSRRIPAFAGMTETVDSSLRSE